MPQEPLLRRGGLTGRIYIVTSYDVIDDKTITANSKYDVTAQFEELVDEGKEQMKDLAAKVQYLVDFMDKRGWLEEGMFTFPDGDSWTATPAPEGG